MVKCYILSEGPEETYETVCFLDEGRTGTFQIKSRNTNHVTARLLIGKELLFHSYTEKALVPFRLFIVVAEKVTELSIIK
jgi:hypothetical protein